MATVLSSADGVMRIVFDCALDVGRRYSAKVSSHPIETGSKVSDHVTTDNPTFSIKGLVSDAHILPLMDRTFSSILFGVGESRAEAARKMLLVMFNNKAFVQLQSGKEPPYANLVITGINIPKDATVNGGFVFDVELEQMSTVSSRYTTVKANRVVAKKKEAEEQDSIKQSFDGPFPKIAKQEVASAAAETTNTGSTSAIGKLFDAVSDMAETARAAGAVRAAQVAPK